MYVEDIFIKCGNLFKKLILNNLTKLNLVLVRPRENHLMWIEIFSLESAIFYCFIVILNRNVITSTPNFQ